MSFSFSMSSKLKKIAWLFQSSQEILKDSFFFFFVHHLTDDNCLNLLKCISKRGLTYFLYNILFKVCGLLLLY